MYNQKGTSLLELMIAIGVTMIALTSIAASLIHSVRISEDTRKLDIIKTCVRNVVEELRDADFQSIVSNFGAGSAQEFIWCTDTGSVEFSRPTDADTIGKGRIQFFNDESRIPASFAGLDSGFDLNGNGEIESVAVVDFQMLPVRILLEYEDSAGARSLQLDMILSEDGIL